RWMEPTRTQLPAFLLCSVFFFFSSRRRHTRFSRDWSSDVCSSDLSIDMVLDKLERQIRKHKTKVNRRFRKEGVRTLFKESFDSRSEERRVGKECRCRWWPCR